jgi:hypothetical protein
MVEQEVRGLTRTLTRGRVTLTVTIGDGQLGGSSLALEGEPLEPVGDIVDAVIGTASKLRGKRLEVRTLVADINLQSNLTEVTYDFTGVKERSQTLQHRVQEHGNAVIYIVTVVFEAS